MNVYKYFNFVYAFCQTYIFNLLYCTCMIWFVSKKMKKKEKKDEKKKEEKKKSGGTRSAVGECEEAENKKIRDKTPRIRNVR